MTAEVRARTLTGRDQIADDGRHLVDGIPFGRPYLRRPNRPDLRIPAPADTPALTSGLANFELGPQDMEFTNHLPASIRGLLSGLDLSKPEDREKAQESLALAAGLSNSFGADEPIGSPPGSNPRAAGPLPRLTNGKAYATQRSGHRPTKNDSRKVQFQMLGAQEEDLDSEEDDEDFEPGNEDADEDMEEDSANDSDSASSSASETTSSDSESGSDSDSDDSSSDSDEESDASSAPEVRSSKGNLPDVLPSLPASSSNVAPGKGRRATQARNQRRTRTNRLRHLQQSGKLPSTATLKDLAEYETGTPKEEPEESTAHQPYSNWTGKRKRIDGDEDGTSVVAHNRRKEELAKTFGIEIASTLVEREDFLQHTVTVPSPSQTQPTIEVLPEKETPETETPRKRLRPDTSAISRILARQAAVSLPVSTLR